MTTSHSTNKAAPAGRSKSGPDAIKLLKEDHSKVSALFEKYENADNKSSKQKLCQQICLELTVHAQIEEEIFYPLVKEALDDDDELVPEATVEHGSIKELIAALKEMSPDDELYDAKVKVMSEWVKHHVKEEQNEMFPKARKTDLDLKKLGAQLAERKKQLLAELSS